jgi:hypothetical protein
VYRVKSGKTIAERISELTGIPLRTVQENLDGKYKDPSKAHDAGTAPLGVGERVRVPEPLADPVRGISDTVKGLGLSSSSLRNRWQPSQNHPSGTYCKTKFSGPEKFLPPIFRRLFATSELVYYAWDAFPESCSRLSKSLRRIRERSCFQTPFVSKSSFEGDIEISLWHSGHNPEAV